MKTGPSRVMRIDPTLTHRTPGSWSSMPQRLGAARAGRARGSPQPCVALQLVARSAPAAADRPGPPCPIATREAPTRRYCRTSSAMLHSADPDHRHLRRSARRPGQPRALRRRGGPGRSSRHCRCPAAARPAIMQEPGQRIDHRHAVRSRVTRDERHGRDVRKHGRQLGDERQPGPRRQSATIRRTHSGSAPNSIPPGAVFGQERLSSNAAIPGYPPAPTRPRRTPPPEADDVHQDLGAAEVSGEPGQICRADRPQSRVRQSDRVEHAPVRTRRLGAARLPSRGSSETALVTRPPSRSRSMTPASS